MKICHTCQHSYPDDLEFCPQDGGRLRPDAREVEEHLASQLLGRFHIIRHLGAGGMGSVFLAEQITVGDRLVAIKVLNRKLLDDPEFLLRFKNEAASTGRVHHPNVVTIYESGQADDGTPYIAMEYLEGESMRQALERQGALPVPDVARMMQQAARGLNAAHKLGIIHRDLKPDNIFLARGDDDETIVKILDFGIAKLRESSLHTRTGTAPGTPAYMSYEQAFGMRSDELDLRSDIYSLGVVAYEMLSGQVPFHSDTPMGYARKHLTEAPPPFRTIAPGLDVSPAVESVVIKALAKDRNLRYSSALDFAHALAGAAVPAPQPQPTVPLPSTQIFSRSAPAVGEEVPSTKIVTTPAGQEPVAPTPQAPPKAVNPRVLHVGPSRGKYILLAVVLLAVIAGGVWYFSRPAPTSGQREPFGTVIVQSSPEAEIFLDDSERGRADTSGRLAITEVPAGSHELRVAAPGKTDYRLSINVVAGQEARVDAVLTEVGPPPGPGALVKPTQLDVQDILELLQGQVPSSSIVRLVNEQGIRFSPAIADLNRIRAEGGSEALIQAIQQASSRQLSEQQVLDLLKGGVQNSKIAELVRERGIRFQSSDDVLKDIRAAGGTDELIQAILQSSARAR